MPGFKAVPASIRDFGTAVGDLAPETEQAKQYANQWLGIGYAEARMFATVVEQATEVREALAENYRRMQELAEAAGIELARAADHYEETDVAEQERLDSLYPAPGEPAAPGPGGAGPTER